MEIKYTMGEKEFLAFNEHFIKTSPTIKKSLAIQRYVVPIIYLIIPFILKAVDEDFSLWYSFTIFLLVGILWVIFYPKYFHRSTTRRVQKMLRESHQSFGETTLIIQDDGIEETQGTTLSKVGWDQISELHTTNDYYYIFFSGLKAFVIPTTVLSAEDKNSLLDIMKKHNKTIIAMETAS
ncbi:MAG: YcxB family protein [Bacillaceae bacterium]